MPNSMGSPSGHWGSGKTSSSGHTASGSPVSVESPLVLPLVSGPLVLDPSGVLLVAAVELGVGEVSPPLVSAVVVAVDALPSSSGMSASTGASQPIDENTTPTMKPRIVRQCGP